jgi:hypothetical protein
MKRLLTLLIVAALGWAGYHTVPVYLRYFQFDEAVEEVARFAGTRSEEEVRQRVLELAEEYDVPLEAEDLVVQKVSGNIEIALAYVERVELLPTYFYDWEFDVETPSWGAERLPQ